MANKVKIKEIKRAERQKRTRKRLTGTPERPRLCVHRSLKNFQAQIVDDTSGKVLLGVSSLNKDVKKQIPFGGNTKSAAVLGELIAKQAVEKGVTKVSFDRGGYMYHGRVKAFAEAARKAGLEF